MSTLDFLDGHAPEPVAVPVEQPADGPARGADGKFASAHAEAAPVEEPAPAPPPAPAPDKPESGHVPITALLDEREKRQAAEREMERLRAAQPAQEAGEKPYLDPDTENALLQTRLNISEEMARDKYTDEVVEAAKAAAIAKFATNPAFQAEVLSKPNPYKYVVEWHKAEQRLEAVKDPTEFEAFQAWKAAQAAGLTHPAPASPAPAAVPASPPAPPRSLASAVNAGGSVDTSPQGPGVAFDNVIK